MVKYLFILSISLVSFSTILPAQSLINQAIQLNGIDQYIRVEDAVYREYAGTIELWAKWSGADEGKRPLFGGTNVDGSKMPGLFLDRGELFWEFGDLAAQTTSITLEENKWYHLAISYEQQASDYLVIVWLNGQIIAKQEEVPPPISWLPLLDIGHAIGGPTDYFEGELDELRIWSRARSQTEIRTHMCQYQYPRYVPDSTLLLYAGFDEYGGTVIEDGTNNYTMMLQNGSGTERGPSGAAVGNISIQLYPNNQEWQDTTLTITYQDREQIKLSDIKGHAGGIHIYRVGPASYSADLPLGYQANLATGIYRTFIVDEDQPTTFTIELSQPQTLSRPLDNRLRLIQHHTDQSTWQQTGAYFDRNTQTLIQPESDADLAYAIAYREDASADQPGAGSAISFDGINDQVLSSFEISSHAVQGISIEFWFESADLSRRQTLLELGANGDLRIGLDADSSLFIFHNTQTEHVLGKIETGKPYHLAYTHDMGTDEGLLYLNGLFIGKVTVGIGTIDKGFLRLGNSSAHPTSAFTGYMDEVRIWDGYSDGETVRTWMLRRLSHHHPRHEHLLLHYPFDEDEGTLIIEDRAGKYDGNMVGMHARLNRRLSSIPLGDATQVVSAEQLGNTRLELSHRDGDRIRLKHIQGSELPSQIYLYRVDQKSRAEHGSYLTHWSDLRYWGIFMVGGSPDVRYTLEFDYAGYPSIVNEAGLTLATRSGPTEGLWTNRSASLDMENHRITLEGKGNQEVVLGESLPFQVLWENVSARWNAQNIDIHWQISGEEGLEQFHVERSVDGLMFSSLADIKPDPTRNGDYSYTDRSAHEQDIHTWYYRIRQVDLQGIHQYSEVVQVQGTPTAPTFSVSPNPVRSKLSVILPDRYESIGLMRIMTLEGKIMSEAQIPAFSQEITAEIHDCPSGIYLLQIQLGDRIWSKRIYKK